MARLPRRAELAQIDAQRCTGCGRCIAACHLPIIAFATQGWRKFAVLNDAAACTGCQLCARRCPVGAIAMVPATADLRRNSDCLGEPG